MRNLKCRFKILVGPFAGQIVEGAHIGAWDTLEAINRYDEMEKQGVDLNTRLNFSKGHVDWSLRGDGCWIPALNRRFSLKNGNGGGYTQEAEDLHVPFDRYNREIHVGDVIAYAMRDLIVAQMKITHFKSTVWGCTMHGVDVDSNRKTKNSYPHRCINLT